jgi:hypothetical protein
MRATWTRRKHREPERQHGLLRAGHAYFYQGCYDRHPDFATIAYVPTSICDLSVEAILLRIESGVVVYPDGALRAAWHLERNADVPCAACRARWACAMAHADVTKLNRVHISFATKLGTGRVTMPVCEMKPDDVTECIREHWTISRRRPHDVDECRACTHILREWGALL